MNISQLKEEAQKHFDTLVKERTEHQDRVTVINEALLKLQGEYAAYEKMEKKTVVGQTPDANTIVAKPKGVKGGK